MRENVRAYRRIGVGFILVVVLVLVIIIPLALIWSSLISTVLSFAFDGSYIS